MKYIKKFIDFVSKSDDKAKVLEERELYIVANMTKDQREALVKSGELFLEASETMSLTRHPGIMALFLMSVP